VVYPAYTTWGTLPAGQIVAAFSWVSGTNHLVTYFGAFTNNATIRWLVLGNDSKGPNLLRSADWAISASLMMAVNLTLYSMPTDATALTLQCVLTALVMLAGYAVDVLVAVGAPLDASLIFYTTAALYAMSWAPLFAIFHEILNTSDSHNGLTTARPPDEVIAYIAYLFITFLSFPAAQWWKKIHRTGWSHEYHVDTETLFAWLSLLAKLPLLMIFDGGVAARRNTVLPGAEPREPEDFLWQSLAVGLGTVFLLGAWMKWFPYRKLPATTPAAF